MTKDTPTDSQADEWIDNVLKKLIVNTHDQASDTEAMRPDQVTHFTNYRAFFESAKAAIQAKLAEAEQAAKQKRIAKNRSLCGCPMCTFHSEAFELQHRQALNERSE